LRATSPSRASRGRTAPRTILKRQLARAKELGYDFKIGLELEYFLVRRKQDGSIEIADQQDTLEKPCYDMAGLTRRYDFLTTVSKYCNEMGWGNYANDHEDANGQFEQNFEYDDALISCDRAIFFRYMVHTLAEQHGMVATFMPKPFTNLTGNGCHFHMSLWDGETNLFLDEDDPRGLGLSELSYNFIGGLKSHARAYSAVTAPTVNSYKRLKLGTTTSGATWSPVWISYGYNNRTQMLRIPGPGRIEDRTIDGSTNPYLAATAVLAAGLDGIEKKLDAGEPNAENLYSVSYEELTSRGLETLPTNLLTATMELEKDDVLREALGHCRNEDYVDYFIKVKRDEWNRYHEHVTPWEINEYLTRF
jgi:glutamine synthetase